MTEIRITDIEGVLIGQNENESAGTGCTVLVSEKGMRAGIDVRGGGPASRETELLNPVTAEHDINAVVLAGGSAFGLDAAGGVMQCLEEHGIGYDVGVTRVPLTVQSDIFDLTVGDKSVRPDKKMGYEAALRAIEGGNYKDGNYGGGCGATVGKLKGMDFCMKSGIGSYAVQIGELKVGAVVIVNALGDVYDYQSGKKLAGVLTDDKSGFDDAEELLYKRICAVENRFTGNTTIGAVITNAVFDKPRLCKIASMAHNGLARSIRPVHTSADGDSIYALSTGDVNADGDVVGTLAAKVMAEAVRRAVLKCDSAYGYIAAKDRLK